MTRLTILEYPDPRLRIRALPVSDFDADLGRLIDDMLETLHASRAIGLAATQVDVHRQIVAIDVSHGGDAPQVFINPQTLTGSAVGLVEESCLSLPGIVDNVKRPTRIRVGFHDRTGAPQVRDLEGLAAVCLQHEMDHLRGILFVDRLPLISRLRIRGRLRKRRQETSDRAGNRTASQARP